MTYRLEHTQVVPASLPDVFAFFKDATNLESITPPWLNFKILSASDDVVREGTLIAYRLRWQIFPLRWESRITEYEENARFADEMIRGPYKRWYHRHLFRETADGVAIRDEVEYELPFGVLGRLAHAIAVRRQLEQIFAFRRDRIAEMFGSVADGAPTHLILFAHGSADPAWRAPHDALVQRLSGEVGADSVSVAFLERMEPSLEVAVATAQRAGAARVVILPVFVAAGKHLRHDLPALVTKLRDAHPALDLTVLPPVGEDPRFADTVAAIAADALSAPTALEVG